VNTSPLRDSQGVEWHSMNVLTEAPLTTLIILINYLVRGSDQVDVDIDFKVIRRRTGSNFDPDLRVVPMVLKGGCNGVKI
jgi:hypothetical protein